MLLVKHRWITVLTTFRIWICLTMRRSRLYRCGISGNRCAGGLCALNAIHAFWMLAHLLPESLVVNAYHEAPARKKKKKQLKLSARQKQIAQRLYIYICMNTVGWARPSFCPSMVTPWTTLPHQRVVNVPSRSSTLEEATVSSTFLKHFSRHKELAY